MDSSFEDPSYYFDQRSVKTCREFKLDLNYFFDFAVIMYIGRKGSEQIMNNITIVPSEGLAYVGQLGQQMVNAMWCTKVWNNWSGQKDKSGVRV